MTPSRLAYLIATLVFLVITVSISYSSFKAPPQKPVTKVSPMPTIRETVSPSPTLIIAEKTVSTPRPTSVPTTKPIVVAPTVAVDTRYIIVVDGQKYDVTVFKNRHSGGDIFNCGTDMSTIFHDQHNQKFLNQMGPYKI